MRHKPEHTCFHACAGCAFDLGAQSVREKPGESAKYVWMVVGSDNPCDIRRYSFSHEEGIGQLAHAQKRKRGYKDYSGRGMWSLFKLVKVKKTK